ncbi:thioredoxin domain-containing protein [uncultured Cellulomonas sp.]|uniref:thioredoxin domain-containing protein n=1 Tax=uncultured Cellulomonas sp. TaxID=189682 RepID=UPI0028EF7DDE|nr:thioredoxin domain-containing protein [uncultured Cellulomonas sp.]
MPNRLATATSPYLLQHADNPVDWLEWGDDAFAQAAARDVPVLVSVGYAACHWCHVMAHESFEDEATAAFMNEHFVCVKVDREERPDVDAVYMAATQAMTGAGGWPMTVFTTPTGEPFFCGTYFPPRRVHGMPSFPEVLASVAAAWTTRRAEIEDGAGTITAALSERAPGVAGPGDGYEVVVERALAGLATTFDAVHGGFGGAPKFPPSMLLEWLLRHHARTGEGIALELADRTLDAMARGGMYDQLAGGFSRYSVDASWTVPHFEKMLYDNALLLRAYVHAWRATGSGLAHRVAEETAHWLLADLRTVQGGFASSLDADSEGREGAFYAWAPQQLRDVLGDDDGAWAADVLGVSEQGTFEHGSSVLQLRSDPADGARLDALRARLREARERRPRPARDDKVVSGWNGLAVGALAEAGLLLERPALLDAATAAAELLRTTHVRTAPDGSTRLVRASRDGVPGTAAGVLEDYAHVADGLLTLFAVTGAAEWFRTAEGLLETVLVHFGAPDGGLRDTADDETDPVLARVRLLQDPADGPTPSGQAAAAGALLTYSALTGSVRHREAAERALHGPLQLAGRFPRAAGAALAVAEALLDGPREVAVVGPGGDRATQELHRVALRSTAPGLVVALGEPGAGGVPLLRDRPLVGGRATAYVCRGFVCDLPTTSADGLARQLAPA